MKKLKKILGLVIYNCFGNLLPGYKAGKVAKFGFIVRRLCMKLIADFCGKNVEIGKKIKFSSNIVIGNNSGIGDETYFQGKVTIGNDVMMGPRCAFIAQNHNFSDNNIPMRLQGDNSKEIIIENNVWIGYGVIVLPGVHIGSNSIIGAGSIVTKDIPNNSIAVGVPAKVKKER